MAFKSCLLSLILSLSLSPDKDRQSVFEERAEMISRIETYYSVGERRGEEKWFTRKMKKEEVTN